MKRYIIQIEEKASPKKQNYMLLKANSRNSAQLHKHNDGCQNVNIKENVEAIKSDYFFNKKNCMLPTLAPTTLGSVWEQFI